MSGLTVDPDRAVAAAPTIGILVRAKAPRGRMGNYDVWALDRESLLAWVRSRDPTPHASRDRGHAWREEIILTAFGHRTHLPELPVSQVTGPARP